MIKASDKSIVGAGRWWRTGLSRPVVVRAVVAVSVLAGTKLIWELGGWVNAQITWPVPFDLAPGAAVLVATGATVALARGRPGVALSGSLLTMALAIGWGAARAYWWPALRHAVEGVSQTTAFAVSAIAGTIAVVVGALVFVLQWKPVATEDGDSGSSPPAI